VYFSIPDDVTADSDYNVDHSIFFFLMDKKGESLNYYGQNMTAPEIARSMIGVVRENMHKKSSK
jgi:protein SCO1/2